MAGKPRDLPAKPVKKGGHSFLKGPKQAGVKSKGGKLTSVKNQIRGLQRLLSKDSLDQKLRRNLEVKLTKLQQNQVQHKQEETERKFAVRYHKIRFFERVKLDRRISQLEGKQARGHSLTTEEQQDLTNAKGDLQYVVHFPKGERYVSILKEATEPEGQAALVAERARLRKLIKHQMAETAMLADADEGLGQGTDMAVPTADVRADEFFLESEPSERSDISQEPAVPLKASAPDRGVTADVVSGSPNSKAGSAHKPQHQGISQQRQQQQQQQQLQKRPQQRQQQLRQQRKRKHEPDMDADNLYCNITQQHKVSQLEPGDTDSQPGRRKATSAEDSRPTQQSAPCELQSQRAASMRHKAPVSQAAPAAGEAKAAWHSQQGDRQQHEQSATGQVRSRGVSAAERSALLLQKLQQKHSKSAVLKPALMPDATVSAGRETGHRKPTAARQMQRQLHSLPQMPATISNSSTVAGRHVVESRAASHSTEPPVAIIAHHTAMSGQAASANAPVRTRAEGGRKRRR